MLKHTFKFLKSAYIFHFKARKGNKKNLNKKKKTDTKKKDLQNTIHIVHENDTLLKHNFYPLFTNRKKDTRDKCPTFPD